MTVREQLIEILRKPIFPHELADPTEAVADYLLDSGVTVQRWIPVTERKPTAADADAKGKVFAYSKEGTANAHGWWFVATSPTIFTHWMPPPQAPGKDGA